MCMELPFRWREGISSDAIDEKKGAAHTHTPLCSICPFEGGERRMVKRGREKTKIMSLMYVCVWGRGVLSWLVEANWGSKG